MVKKHSPNSVDDVFNIMKQYVEKKKFSFIDSKISYLAEDFFLFWESRGWKGTTYWPPLAMRWILNNLDKQYKATYKPQPKTQGKSVRDKIMERETGQENND